MYLTKRTIKGAKFEIGVTENGTFFCFIGDSKVEARSMETLEEKIKAVTKQGRIVINVPFTYWPRNERPRQAVCTGKHATQGDLLIRYLDGDKETDRFRQHRHGELCEPLDAETLAQATKLADEFYAARNALNEFHDKIVTKFDSPEGRYDLLERVNAAMTAAATSGGDTNT